VILDVYNKVAGTRLLSLLLLTNPQGLVFANLAITLSLEVGAFEFCLNPISCRGGSTKRTNSFSELKTPVPYVAYVGIDWADQKHDLSLFDRATQQFESSVIGAQPEAIATWVEGLRQRFPQEAIAICTEQKCGPLI
jgi:hypothetical protein